MCYCAVVGPLSKQLHSKQEALEICIFTFAEEGNSSSQNLQHVFLASVNFLFRFPKNFIV